MLTTSDLQDALSTVKYKQNFVLEVDEPDIVQGPYLHIFVLIADADADAEIDDEVQLRIHSPIPPQESYTSFYNWLLWRLKQVEIHECMEFFRVDGAPYLDPHSPM